MLRKLCAHVVNSAEQVFYVTFTDKQRRLQANRQTVTECRRYTNAMAMKQECCKERT